MDLSLRRLRILQEFARQGTVADTAAALHYTSSAVSQQLAKLEREIGKDLLEPIGRRVQLTDAGRGLLPHAENILAAAESARIALEQQQTVLTAELNIGVLATVAASLLPPTLDVLTERHPNVTVRTHEVTPEEAVAAVRDGDLDVSFVLNYPDAPSSWDPKLDATLIAVEHLHLVVPTGHDLLGRGPIDLTETADHDWVVSGPETDFGKVLQVVCRRFGFEPRITHQVDEQATAMAMVAGGLGITLAAELGLRTLRPHHVEACSFAQPFLRHVLLLSRHTTRPSETAFTRASYEVAHSLGLAPPHAPPSTLLSPQRDRTGAYSPQAPLT